MSDEIARRRRGPKKHQPLLKRRCVHLSDAEVKMLRAWGRGSVAAGLRWLIDVAAPFVRRPLEDRT